MEAHVPIQRTLAIPNVLLRCDLTDIPKERVGCCCRDRERLALDEDAEAGIKEIGIAVQVGEVELLAHHLYVPRGPDL